MTEEQRLIKIRVLWICLVMVLLLAAHSYRTAKGQEHEHGVNVPDWYDNECCNKQDCRPIENSDVSYGVDNLNNPVVMYKEHNGIVEHSYIKSRWRKSRDERYHACFRGTVDYCIYLLVEV